LDAGIPVIVTFGRQIEGQVRAHADSCGSRGAVDFLATLLATSSVTRRVARACRSQRLVNWWASFM
jgi:hypothetical protein